MSDRCPDRYARWPGRRLGSWPCSAETRRSRGGTRLSLRALLAALVFGCAAPAAMAETTTDTVRGEKLYLRYCRGCHGKDGRGGAHTFMPHIQNLTKKGYIDELPDEHLFGVIHDGGEAYGLSAYMPAWGRKLSDEEINDIIAHIRTLPTH